MKREIRADYSRIFLLPPSVEEWVPADHPARFIRDFVGSLDFEGLGFRSTSSETGRPAYSAELLLSVWLFGYLRKIRSSRGLERACRENMSLLWLTGMNVPDHNTLWRFFSANKDCLRLVFRQVVGVAYSSGLVGLVVHAVDGTKIRSRASDGSAWHKEDLEKLLASVDSSIEETLSAIESSEVSELGEYRLPEALVDAEKRRAEIKRRLAALAEIERSHLHPDDPEARMVRSAGATHFGYNAQVVVDGESSLIVGEEVVNAGSDNEMLVKMVEEERANIGQAASETVADGGYYSPNELAKAEAMGVEVLVPVAESPSSSGEFHKSRFSYDAAKDEYLCPLGTRLGYWRTRRNPHDRYDVRVYRCRSYRDCPRRWECSRSKKGRCLVRGEHDAAISRQREKQKSFSKRQLMNSRQWIVEPVFAQIKEHMGFRRWSMCGIDNVRAQWSLLCTVFNLKKLYRHWLEGRLVFSR